MTKEEFLKDCRLQFAGGQEFLDSTLFQTFVLSLEKGIVLKAEHTIVPNNDFFSYDESKKSEINGAYKEAMFVHFIQFYDLPDTAVDEIEDYYWIDVPE